MPFDIIRNWCVPRISVNSMKTCYISSFLSKMNTHMHTIKGKIDLVFTFVRLIFVIVVVVVVLFLLSIRNPLTVREKAFVCVVSNSIIGP